VDFASSAARHGISKEAVDHALRHPLVFAQQEFDGELRILVVGPDMTGVLLEIIVVPSTNPTLVIHADRLRPKFYSLLRR
jgi:hypothetical protein